MTLSRGTGPHVGAAQQAVPAQADGTAAQPALFAQLREDHPQQFIGELVHSVLVWVTQFSSEPGPGPEPGSVLGLGLLVVRGAAPHPVFPGHICEDDPQQLIGESVHPVLALH